MTTLYKTGTISIGAGSTSVTGTGTAWTTSGTRPGDLLIAGGALAEIASVNSATGITLANGWPAATQAAVNYAILQLDDGLRALIAANTLLQALDGGTLTSLAGLGGAANQLPYFTGEHVMGLTGLTAAARALLDDADFTAMRTTLGLDTAIELTSADDLNGLTKSGLYYNPTGGNSPGNNYPITSAGSLLNLRRSATNWVQEFTSYGGSGSQTTDLRRFIRTYGGSGFTPWSEVPHQGRLVGNVSQSGGIPTGAIIERGSNSNGHYIRFADGTQICWKYIDDTTTAWSVAEGALFRRASAISWTYPATFSAAPVVTATAHIGNDWVTGCRPRSTPDAASVLLQPWASAAPGSSTGKSVFAMAVGRWF